MVGTHVHANRVGTNEHARMSKNRNFIVGTCAFDNKEQSKLKRLKHELARMSKNLTFMVATHMHANRVGTNELARMSKDRNFMVGTHVHSTMRNSRN